ncbi:MAG: hypothetical protein WA715_02440 [Candidatus Acidiferrum sp.]|jgi:hypothetical protein
MSPGHAASQDHAKPGGDKGNPGNFGKVMKWVGYITAILSLAGAITGIVKVVAHRAETPLQIDTLLSSATVAIRGKDYASAWQSLDDAAKLNANSGKVRTAREDLAMTWLDDGIHAEPDGKFSGITTKLKPVLAQGVAATKLGPRQADLLAHIGWCYFLESRDGIFGPDPPGQYARAIEEDANNPYAQAMWGHWLLWDRTDLDEAEKHFAAGVASKREGDYVRRMQLDALMNHNNERFDAEVVRVANDMRKEQRAIDAERTDHIFGIYFFEINPRDQVPTKFVNAVPPAEHLATFHWLFDNADLSEDKKPERTYFLAVLNEAAGQRDQALELYRSLQAKPGEKEKGESTWPGVDAGVKRLSKAGAAKS